MRLNVFRWCLLAAIVVVSFKGRCAEIEATQDIVAPFKVWSEVKSPDLKNFKAPVADRFELPNGMVVFLLEDHELPLVELSMTMRFGDIHEPSAGMADAVANVMRSGGSEKYPGDTLDQILEDMAAEISVGIGVDSGSASLSCLREDFDKGLDLFVDVLRHPLFPEEKIDLYLSQARTSISKRNDSPHSITGREFRRALYGEKSPYAKITEYADLNKIDRAAMQAYHKTFFHPNMFILGIVGDFKTDEMLAKLRASFGDWPAEKVELPKVPEIATDHKRKVLFIDRPRLNQTTFTMGHVMDLRRNSKEYPALQILNDVLSGGMSARMFTEVRTKKGLAYSVWGFANINYDRPGAFYCTALTRNEQTLESIEAVKHEVVRIRDEGITQSELEVAREHILNTFVFNFDSPGKIIGRQITYEFYHYPVDFAEQLLEAIKKVGVEDVNKTAKKLLDPDKFVLLGVGNTKGLDPARTFHALKDVQFLDVTIPTPRAAPMVIDPKREQEGQRILRECVKAAGGVDVFKAIKSFKADVLLETRGYKMKACLYCELPDNARVDIAGPFGPITQVMTRDAAWKAAGNSVSEMKPADARKNLRTLLHSDLSLMRVLATGSEPYNVQALDPKRENDRDLLGVEIESQSMGRIRIWFDAQTRLIAKIRYVADGLEKEYDKLFSEHTNFDKMLLAKSVVDKDPDGAKLQIESVQINPTLKADLFTRPEKAAAPEQP